MKLRWRKQNSGSFDHEAVWGAIGLLALAASRFLPLDRMALTTCWFHRLSGLPCPSCGGTRAFVALAHGNWMEGIALNPGAALLFFLLVGFVPYAALVVAGRMPRLRVSASSSRERMGLVLALALLVLVNLVYLVWVGR